MSIAGVKPASFSTGFLFDQSNTKELSNLWLTNTNLLVRVHLHPSFVWGEHVPIGIFWLSLGASVSAFAATSSEGQMTFLWFLNIFISLVRTMHVKELVHVNTLGYPWPFVGSYFSGIRHPFSLVTYIIEVQFLWTEGMHCVNVNW